MYLMAHVTHKNVTCLDMFGYRTTQIDSVQKKMKKKRFIKICMVRYVCLSSKSGMLILYNSPVTMELELSVGTIVKIS